MPLTQTLCSACKKTCEGEATGGGAGGGAGLGGGPLGRGGGTRPGFVGVVVGSTRAARRVLGGIGYHHWPPCTLTHCQDTMEASASQQQRKTSKERASCHTASTQNTRIAHSHMKQSNDNHSLYDYHAHQHKLGGICIATTTQTAKERQLQHEVQAMATQNTTAERQWRAQPCSNRR